MSCKDCTKRVPGCHATCEDYAAFKAELEKAKERRAEYYNSKRKATHQTARSKNAVYKSPKR